MNVSKSKAIALLVSLVVFVSVATNITTNYFTSKHKENYNVGSSSQLPEGYARFASATKALDTDFTVAADLTVHAVVHVKTKGTVQQPQMDMFNDDPFFQYFFGPQQRNNRRQQKQEAVPLGAGSGVIISKDGYIVTNNHVIANSTEIEVTLNDKRTFKAKLVGTDPNTDIALIKINADDLPTIVFGNSDDLKVGEWVLAVGNPFNLTSTVTAGIVSAKARSIGIIGSNGSGNMPIESFIQTDAAINPGNSGGALVNTKGELIGINAAIASQTGSYAGYGFAIPVSIVKKVVTDLREHGAVQRAILGVNIANLDADAQEVKDVIKDKNIKTLNGALVMNLVEKGAAEKAGVKKGDVINEVNGVKVNSVSELQEQIGRYKPGDKVTLGILRENKPITLNVGLTNAQGNTKVVTYDGTINSLGAKFKEIDTKIQKSLGLDYGLQIESLTKGKFNDNGIKPGFIIIKINNNPIRSEEDVQAAYDEAMRGDDKVLYIAGVYPNGKVTYYAVNLED
ncbi:Protease Do [uncultured Paludibacter sp.]|uniref:Protease Do n=1 Tax=uncultured Paludibacter sp. TaxID=497635 RepID=A0A653AAP5_9BACT|nr:Protease Do [uncultured Paludibacter sp.]